MVLRRTIKGLARLSQEGSLNNAHIGSQKLLQRRQFIYRNPEMVSTIVSKAPDVRTANLALDHVAAIAEHIPGFRS